MKEELHPEIIETIRKRKMKEELHPEIIEAIRKRAPLGFPNLPLDWSWCTVCYYVNHVNASKMAPLIEKYGKVCVDCRRKAGVAW